MGAALGARLIWLQTFGERWLGEGAVPASSVTGTAAVIRPIPQELEHYPEDYGHNPDADELRVGGGLIGPVSSEVYGYSQSGFRPVESWLRYRMKERGGRARRGSSRTPLDDIRPHGWTFTGELLELLWVVEGCVALWPELADFLELVICGPTLQDTELPLPQPEDTAAPKTIEIGDQESLGFHE
jgi:hypothetical protein